MCIAGDSGARVRLPAHTLQTYLSNYLTRARKAVHTHYTRLQQQYFDANVDAQSETPAPTKTTLDNFNDWRTIDALLRLTLAAGVWRRSCHAHAHR